MRDIGTVNIAIRTVNIAGKPRTAGLRASCGNSTHISMCTWRKRSHATTNL